MDGMSELALSFLAARVKREVLVHRDVFSGLGFSGMSWCAGKGSLTEALAQPGPEPLWEVTSLGPLADPCCEMGWGLH